jgi:arginine exporter protein ArgO
VSLDVAVALGTAAAFGLGLGIVTGMPLGVINVAIVDAVAAGAHRRAVGVGLGGAIADTVHALLAFIGVGQLVTARPDLVRVLALVAACLVIGYAIVQWRGRPARAATAGMASTTGMPSPAMPTPAAARLATASGAPGMAIGVTTGVMLTLPNPGALSAWVAVAAAAWPAATIVEAITIAVGVGVGSAAWFTFLARLVARIPREHRALAVIPRVAIVALVAIAIVGLVRVV